MLTTDQHSLFVPTRLGPYGVYRCHFSTTTSLIGFLWHLTSCSNWTRAILGNAGLATCGTQRLSKACPIVHIILAALAICLHCEMVRWTMPLTAHACGFQRHCKRATQLTTLRNHDWGCQPSNTCFFGTLTQAEFSLLTVLCGMGWQFFQDLECTRLF
jgi:hypothetical protein